MDLVLERRETRKIEKYKKDGARKRTVGLLP
jgi:hypothetical protein